MKTLIKTDNSLILVSDEEIKEGNLYISTAGGYSIEITKALKVNKDYIYPEKSAVAVHLPHKSKKVLSQSPKLSKEVADEIGWIDVEELANQHCKDCGVKPNGIVWNSYKIGFQKAQELNQKKYTEEDMRIMFDFGKEFSIEDFGSKYFEEKLQSLSQPQQWQVEAEEIDGVWTINKILKS